MSLTVSKNSMGKLPTALVQNVQTFLSYKEALGVMRLVCQSWKQLVPLDRLIIGGSGQFLDDHLESLSKRTTLWKEIYFNFCPRITSKAFKILQKTQTQLRCLELMQCSNILDFKFLSSFPLEECRLSMVGVKDSDLQGLKMPHLEKLELLSCSNLSSSCFMGAEFPFLKSLAMKDTRITGSAFAFIKKMPLTHLSLHSCRKISGSIGISSLADMPLVALNLARTEVTDKDMEDLMSGSMKDTLTDLDLTCSSITDKSISLLGMRLQKLTLSDSSGVSNDALRRLSHWTELNTLKLSYCSVDDRGLVFLKQLPIRYLGLWGCKGISDAGVEHLACMPLEELVVSWCSVTAKGRERLPASIKKLTY